MRSTSVPFEVVKTLLDNQNAFNEKLIQILGLHLEKASEAYRDALNPPIESSTSAREMSYSRETDESGDLQYQLESGLIDMDDIPPNMRRLLGDTEVAVDLS